MRRGKQFKSFEKLQDIMEGQNIKLTYFDMPGRALATRISLITSGVKFTDERITFPQLQGLKTSNPSMVPFGKVPILTINGEHFVESGAHARWAGRQSGLYPSSSMDQLRVDELWDVIDSIERGISCSSDPVEMKRLREEYRDGKLLNILGFLNAKAKNTSSQGPFFLGSEMSIADLRVYAVYLLFGTGLYEHISSDIFSGFPDLLTLFEAVKANPVVANHLKKE